MRKLFGGAVALGLATAGSLALAGPGFAQEDPGDLTHLDATITPNDDGTFTVKSEDNCTTDGGGTLEWAVFHKGDFTWEGGSEDDPVLVDSADLNEDGSWEVTFNPADFDDAGQDAFSTKAEGDDPEAPAIDEVYGPLEFAPDQTAFEWFAFCEPDGSEGEGLTDKITSHPLSPATPESGMDFYKVKPNDDVTAVDVDPCPSGDQLTSVLIVDDEEGDPVGEPQFTPLGEDGHWSVTFKAPTTPGWYLLFAACIDTENEELTGLYDPLLISDQAEGPAPKPPANPIETPHAPPAATPITDEPPFTG